MLGYCLDNVRKRAPLVHCITNYVTVNDVANAMLACGGSPIMSDEPDDVSDITSICDGLYLNIGTLNARSILSMKIAGKRSSELGHMILLDPVGAGASRLRTKTAIELMNKTKITVIRGNISEIKTIAQGKGTTKGVDTNVKDIVTDDTLNSSINMINELAHRCGSIVVGTGAIDLVSDGDRCYIIRNGRAEMSKITGSGCQLSGIMTAFIVSNPDNIFEATVASVCTMGIAGEIAWNQMRDEDGNSTYRNRIIDAIYNMDGKTIDKEAKYEVR